MPFVRGQARPAGSGRKATVANKATVQAKLASLKCDPIEGMARIAMDQGPDGQPIPGNSVQLRGRMYSELAQYLFPRLRSVEHSGPAGGPMELNVSGVELLKSRIDRIAERNRQG